MTSVVVADDHRFFRSGLEEALRSAGHQILASVDDGEAALRSIKKENPELVILDVRMPVMNGVVALESLRSSGDNRPVIALAAEVEDDDLIRLMRAGVNAIVLKNDPEEQLLEAIGEARDGFTCLPASLLGRAMAMIGENESPYASFDRLTSREQEIASLVVRGKRNKDIAAELKLTEGTVKITLHSIFTKLAIKSRTELASRFQPARRP